VSGLRWIILIGFVAGILARVLFSGPNNSTGFILTVALGVAGSFLATFTGRTIGWYRPDPGLPASSLRQSAPSSSCLSGIDWPFSALYPTRACEVPGSSGGKTWA
jgi:uncharacterized membrane protein YeaQ/YmgE (transglycosylase-associated protein family)